MSPGTGAGRSGAGRIVPAETPLTAQYWSAARRGVILLQRCADCGAVLHPPAPVCPGGAAHELRWLEASGLGRLASFTVVTHAAHPVVDGRLPYVIALVELDEGPWLHTGLAVTGPDPIAALRAGCRVAARFVHPAEGESYPVFSPLPDPEPRP